MSEEIDVSDADALIAASQKTGSLGICASFATAGLITEEIVRLANKVLQLADQALAEVGVQCIPIPLKTPSTLCLPPGNVFVITLTDEPINGPLVSMEAFTRYIAEYGGVALLFVFPPPSGDDPAEALDAYLALACLLDKKLGVSTNMCAVRDPPDDKRHGIWCGRAEVFSDA